MGDNDAKEGSITDAERDFLEKAIKLVHNHFDDRIMQTWQVSNALFRMADMIKDKTLKKQFRLIGRALIEKLALDLSQRIATERKNETELMIEESKQLEENKKNLKKIEEKKESKETKALGVTLRGYRIARKKKITTTKRGAIMVI